jgi:hypothetical protein
MPFFAISKPVAGGRQIWLTRAFPFLAWGTKAEAARYPTVNAAREIIGRLSYRDGAGAGVMPLDES